MNNVSCEHLQPSFSSAGCPAIVAQSIAAAIATGDSIGRLDILIILGNILTIIFPAVSMKVDLSRIRHEASALANRHGLEGLAMNDLAEALNIRAPSLYSHVAGLGEVRRLLALHGLEELERGAARATIGKAGPDAIRALLRGYRNFVRQNPGVYAATLPTPPQEDAEWRAAADRLSQTCVAALQGYGLQGAEAVHALRGLRSIAHGFAALEAAGALKNPVDRDDSFTWLVEAFIAVLGQAAERA